MPAKGQDLPRGIFQKDPGSKFYYIQYTDARGRRHREKAGTYRMAEDLLLKREMDKLRHKLPGQRGRFYGVKINELIDDAINFAFQHHDEKSAHDLRLKLERIRITFGDKVAEDVTRQQIADWLDAEAALRKWKPSSRNRYQAAWSMMFRVAVDNKKLAENPVKGLPSKQEDNGRIRYLSVEEEKALNDVVKDPREWATVVLSVNTGMRRSEQERCLVGDYDANTGLLLVRQKKNRRASSIRYVPMTPVAAQAYSLLAVDKKPGDQLCVEYVGDTRWFDKYVEAAGLDDYTWHCNRHTFCSRLVMSGVPIAAVSQYAGHSSLDMTMRYSHLAPNVHELAIQKMMGFYAA
jgi:integrase